MVFLCRSFIRFLGVGGGNGSSAMFKETCIVNTLDLLSVPGEHIQSIPLSLPLEDTLIADPRRHLAELAEKEKVKKTPS